ncbi:hypothetical protein IVB30_31795 [Bradyrhizobium sp. 200]|uniref:hypothetical protein n=1 Tax=Bradyrhizobium sp. 200 TaxID=2782665 RepID=UPI001FFF56AA|nr:hypothetical protein [Bradyrhizobium sp. 200]UPJ47774.1 hypothetical protein IVB30_31795 [Bradyrhizobium sp. 200]
MFAYLIGFARGLAISLIEYNRLPVCLLLLLGACFMLRERREIPREFAVPMLAMVLAVGGKCVVFVISYGRIYAVYLWLLATGRSPSGNLCCFAACGENQFFRDPATSSACLLCRA